MAPRVDMSGSGGVMITSLRRFSRTRVGVLFCMVGVLVAVLVAIRHWPRPPISASFPTSRAIYDINGKLLRLTLSSDDKYRLWTPLSAMSVDLIDAVLLHEDRHYYLHPGVNPVALLRAGLRTYSGGVRQGGSTLTMQLARLVYRLNTRSPWGKIKQIARAMEFELLYSKAQILEAYLNLAPYGQNIEGVGAASLIYFNRVPQRLGLSEALTLAVIPQSPTRRALNDEKKTLVDARDRLYRQWVVRQPEVSDQRGLVQLPMSLRGTSDLPFRAPHVAAMLLADRSLADTGNVIHSTLDIGLQQMLERQLQNYVGRERRVGIVNASAMLLDTRDMGVRALVGSADFYNDAIDGQVNGTQARRSPGSTLKPFVYGLALDQGLLHPMTVLKDAPTAFGPFTPENFDGRFAGPITAREALIRSRNVPAVALSARLAQPTLYQFLRDAGVARMQSEKHYGLGLALGGGEVTMEDLVRLYAMLANRGTLRAVRYTAASPARGTAGGASAGGDFRESRFTPGTDHRNSQDARLLSEEASYIVLDMLRDNPRPNLAYSAKRNIPVAWKTGTSWGFRDAWTVGVFGPYVLAVWIGNFDGQGNPAFIGVQAATPLFFQIVDAVVALHPGISEPSFRQPPNLRRVEVCAASGDLPNAACPLRAQTLFIPGKSPIRVSTLHRNVAIDTRTGSPTCPPFDPKYVRQEVYEFWPSDLAHLFAQAGLPRRRPPVSSCAEDGAFGNPPTITSPLRAITYTQRAGAAPQSIALAAVAEGDARELHWFANETYLGATKPGMPLGWKPGPGTYTLHVVDDQGRTDTRPVRVELVQ